MKENKLLLEQYNFVSHFCSGDRKNVAREIPRHNYCAHYKFTTLEKFRHVG